ncbi:MAG: hypothetical protein GY874_07960, partial [Desulfobacteraceae bacterium]|nr:hypothetical protein [Desulfobacteraceae bacterium]
MKLAFKLPTGPSNRRCERFDPAKMGGLPPIQCVPKDGILNATDNKKKNRVKIQISNHVTKSFELFSEGGPEAVVMLIRSHESIVADQKLKEVYKTASALMTTKQDAIQALDPTSEQDAIEELKMAICELKETCKNTQQEAF